MAWFGYAVYNEMSEKGEEYSLQSLTNSAVNQLQQFEGQAKDLEVKARLLKDELQTRLEKVDWSGLKDKLGLSEADMKDYKESISWAFESNPGKTVEQTKTPEEVERSTEPDKNAPGELVKTQKENTDGKNPQSLKPPPESEAPMPEGAKKVVTSPPPASTQKAPVIQAPSLPPDYVKGMDLLAQAKAETRKALPGMNNQKSHLRNSVKLYEQSRSKLLKVQNSAGLSVQKKKNLEEDLVQINKQIYWAKKFDSI